MKTLLSYACAAALALCALPCCHASSPWDGTWKANESKSKLTGSTATWTMKGPGIFHYSNGSNVEYDFGCDGKTYPTFAERSVVCTGSAATGYDFTFTVHDMVLSKSHRAFSADGKMMTIKGTATRPDGTTYEFDDAMKRLSGGKDLEGKWVAVKIKTGADDVQTIAVKDDMIHIEAPAFKEVIDGKLDGSDATMTGPTVPAGGTMTFKSESPVKMRFTYKLNGKLLREGTDTLSADGKSYTEEEWVDGKVSEKSIVLYEKQ